jgi:hypothetical protein
LPDGSYGTETIVLDDPKARLQQLNQDEDNTPLRRALISTEDDHLASCLAITLTKLAIKTKKNLNTVKYNQTAVDTILIICALLKTHNKKRFDADSRSRMQLCLKILTNSSSHQSLTAIEAVLVDQGRRIFAKFLETHSKMGGGKRLGKRKGEEALLIT